MAERLDDLARVAVQQDQSCRADVECQPEHRRDEQQRREDREVQRTAHEHAHEQDEQRPGDVRGQEQVEQDGRQRDHQHQDDADDRGRYGDLAEQAGLQGCLRGCSEPSEELLSAVLVLAIPSTRRRIA